MSPSFKLFLFCFIALFAEKALFWLYLWQLKNYHLKRFLAHFKTYQGKKLILNPQNIILFAGLLWFIFVAFLKDENIFINFYVFGIFILNLGLVILALKALISFVLLKIKKPIITKKSGLLILAVFLFGAIFAWVFSPFQENGIFLFLLFLLVEPLLISAIVITLEPLTIFKRKQILKKAAQKKAGLPNLKVVAITGSYGKTSVKEYLYLILREKFGKDAVVKTEKHINAEIGVAKTILEKIDGKTKIFIAEIGAYEKGKIKEVCEMIKPNISVLTGINNQHLATFGSQENIIEAKFEIIDGLKGGGTAVFNIDSSLIKSTLENKNKTADLVEAPSFKRILCSTKQEADIMAADIKIEKETVSFKAFSKTGDSAQFNLKAIGKANIENILLALAVAKELAVSLKESAEILKNNNIQQEAIELNKREFCDILLTDYSANLNGILADLEHLKMWRGKKIIIMPCLIELGKTAKETHLKIGVKINEVCDLAIITTKDYFKEIKQTAPKALYLNNPKQIFEKIKNELLLSKEKDNVILIEGRSSTKIIAAILENIIIKSQTEGSSQ